MKRTMFGVAFASMVACSTPSLLGFCGFYVAKADTKLFNHASQVVLVRDGHRTVITMANHFKDQPKEIPVRIPVPTFSKREQIHVGEKALVEHIDAYSAPRLVEHFDENPCQVMMRRELNSAVASAAPMPSMAIADVAKRLGVTIEACAHRRRVRHPDPLGATELGAGHVAPRERLSNSSRRIRGSIELPETEHAVLRREGELEGAGQAGLLVLASAAGGV
jgi:hypothetical protein